MQFNIFKIIKYHLYLLQLENYELGRFLRLLFKKGLWPKKQGQRKSLVWTPKAALVFLLSQILILLCAAVLARFIQTSVLENWVAAAAVFFGLVTIFNLLGFIFLIFTEIILIPLDTLVKKWIIAKAKSKILNLKSEIKIIGIAGSYGKTTMKNALTSVLSTKFKVLSTPESVNTPVGIARWILKNVDSSAEIIVVEMGEHYKGDVEEICNIAKPDIAVVTGINEAHLERLKNLDTAIATIFEIVSFASPGALVVLNGDDQRVMEHYKEFVWPDHRIISYQVIKLSSYQVFNTEDLGWDCKIDGIGEVKVNLLGEYALGVADAAINIGRSLGMSAEEIKKGLENIKPVEHRLQPIMSSSNVLVIDDAYNGNPEGVKEAIKVLSRFTSRRKIFITPGLVETGKAAPHLHREIGKQLAGVADVVVLIKNSVTPWIEEGVFSVSSRPSASESRDPAISREGSGELSTGSGSRLVGRDDKPKIIWFETAQEAHQSLKQILKPNDVVMFQNDWGDQYL